MKSQTKSVEDFIFVAFQIYEGGNENIKLSDISSNLKISRAAATKMSLKLSKFRLIEKSRYSKISLTKKGKSLALKLARKHRVIEVFLHKKLGLLGEELEEQAHSIEHAMSTKTIEKLADYINNPKECPHGKKTY